MKDEIEILHITPDYLVCVKPVGILSQCDGAEDMPFLLRERFGGEIFTLHRLDRNVGGLMVFARTPAAATALSEQIRCGTFVKRYLAAVSGRPEPESGEMSDLLFKDSRSGKSFVVTRPRKGTKEARLAYRTVGSAEGRSLVLVRLFTGRTHQIRVQFASRQMPLLGDGKYGSRDKECEIALWSYSITLNDPASGRQMSFRALPDVAAWPWNLFDWDEKNLSVSESPHE